MNTQDIIAITYVVLLNAIILRGITGPRHMQTHLLLIVTALFVPFISFDIHRLAELPASAWGVCAAFLFAQILHTAFHAWKPDAPHREGPEILMQPLLIVWAVSVRFTVPADLWYRGELGVFLFTTAILFVSLAVVMVIYMGGLTERADDEIDFMAYTVRSPSNAGFLVASAVSTAVTLFVTFGHPGFMVAAIVAFLALKVVLPPEAVSVPR